MAASNFRGLEATNRRETAVLVVAFMLLLGALGLGLDFAARDIAIVDGQLAGFPVLTIAALVFAGVQSIVMRRLSSNLRKSALAAASAAKRAPSASPTLSLNL